MPPVQQEDVDMSSNELMLSDGWDVVVATDAIPSERYAAEEFRRLMAQASGIELPIVADTDRPDRHVLIGPEAAARAGAPGFEGAAFGPEDLRIVMQRDCIAIAGGRPRGTLYGVYTFLEDYVGVRFLTPDHTHVPRLRGRCLLRPLERDYRPPLAFRWSAYGENQHDHAFAARLRVNTVAADEKLGGKTPDVLINHSFFRQLPLEDYAETHPEYFAEIDGKRRVDVENAGGWHGTQPCLTNPDVLRIVTENVMNDLRRQPDTRCISVSMNDNLYNCRCSACAELDEAEGSAMGTLLTFVNSVGNAVAQEFPNVKVGTLAYIYSRKPPRKVLPRPNVRIQLCNIECCQLHPITNPDCPKNTPFCRDMAGWGAICDDIYAWTYITNFRNYLLPCPNLHVLEPNIRFFVENGARGIFMQGTYNAIAADLSDLRNYVVANLLWDPSHSAEALMDEFLKLHYGPAAEPIRGFINLLHNKAEASGWHQECNAKAAEYGLDETLAEGGLKAFAQALEAASSEEVRARVEKASVSAYRLAIEPVWYLGDAAKPEKGLADRMRPLVDKFLELCERHGVTMAAEGTRLEKQRRRLQNLPCFGGRKDV